MKVSQGFSRVLNSNMQLKNHFNCNKSRFNLNFFRRTVTGISKKSHYRPLLKNLTDWPGDIQIRVGSILVKAYTLKPGCTKTLRRSKIYSTYSTRGESSFFCDGSYEPYVWIHNSSHAAKYFVSPVAAKQQYISHAAKYFVSPVAAKQQYISLDDLSACLEMKIYMDGGSGSFSVLKMPRSR